MRRMVARTRTWNRAAYIIHSLRKRYRRMDDKQKELLGQFHQTISEQLNSRLSESPKFFGLLVVVSTGYGYVLFSRDLTTHKALFVLASGLAYASVLWATWYLAALGYAFRFLQNVQHCVEQEIGWADYTPLPENGRRTGEPPRPPKKFSSDPFWLLPSIYHAHAAGLAAFLLTICAAFGWNAREFWSHRFVVAATSAAVLFGLAWIYGWNFHYVKRFGDKWRNPREGRVEVAGPGPSAIFGNPTTWDSSFKGHEKVFRAIEDLRTTVRDLAEATKDSKEELVQVLNALTQICSESMYDVLLLAGNLRGLGAMKIARGMFEISVISAYLVKNPSEVDAYLSFGLVEAWNHVQRVEKHEPGRVPPDVMKEAQAAYNRVKSKFSNQAGRVQFRWTNKTIKQMAEEIGRLNIYEIAYSIASELHHMPISGVIGHELEWTKEALFVAHGSLLDTVVALYDGHKGGVPGFAERLNAAIENFRSTQKQP
jgi:hypothetical protein